jgi:hypothetical protein
VSVARKYLPPKSSHARLGDDRVVSQCSCPQVAPLYTKVTDAMATKLGLSNHTFSARSRDELEPAFDAMVKAGMQAVTVNSEGLAYQQMEFIANLVRGNRRRNIHRQSRFGRRLLRGRTGCFRNGPGWSKPPPSSFRRTARQLRTDRGLPKRPPEQ